MSAKLPKSTTKRKQIRPEQIRHELAEKVIDAICNPESSKYQWAMKLISWWKDAEKAGLDEEFKSNLKLILTKADHEKVAWKILHAMANGRIRTLVKNLEVLLKAPPAFRFQVLVTLDQDFLVTMFQGEHRFPQPQQDRVNHRRPCYDRDHTWLRWAEKEEMTPAKIRDRWNDENPTGKIGLSEAGRDVVKKGLDRAREEQESQ